MPFWSDNNILFLGELLLLYYDPMICVLIQFTARFSECE
jgi:hypothetical protein